MHQHNNYEYIPIEDYQFPISFHHFTRHPKISPHWHEHLELLFIINGKGRIHSDQHVFDVMPGDCVVFNCNEYHFSDPFPRNFEYLVLLLDPSIWKHTDMNDTVCFENFVREPEVLEQLFLEIDAEYSRMENGFRFAVIGNVYKIMRHLIKYYTKKQEMALSTAEYRKMEAITESVKYINNHYKEILTIGELAELVNFSESYFAHSFKEIMGISVVNYINALRIKKARILLLTSDFSISEIAELTGIGNTNYFSRIFKQYCGLTPREYRSNPYSDSQTIFNYYED